MKVPSIRTASYSFALMFLTGSCVAQFLNPRPSEDTMLSVFESARQQAAKHPFDKALLDTAASLGTRLGEYDFAERSFRRLLQLDPAKIDFAAVPKGSRPAPLAALTHFTTGKRVLLFNEAHLLPKTRRSLFELLPLLRKEGFNYLALEALSDVDPGIGERGFATERSGFYLQEPIYGELIRTAAQLGFKIVPYEASVATGAIPERREQAQADHLLALLSSDPNARVVVNAGHAHIDRIPRLTSVRPMGGRLVEALGSKAVLSIDQTWMIDAVVGNTDFYGAQTSAWGKTEPFIVVTPGGTPYSAEPNRYDVSVFFPKTASIAGRPAWLTLHGLRVAHSVNGFSCENQFPCLIEAIYRQEPSDAVAADRCVLQDAKSNTVLYTRNEPLLLRITNADGIRTLSDRPFRLPFDPAQ